jgi:threonine synthase
VIHLVDHYEQQAGGNRVFFVEVSEQDIMDWQLQANRNGHIACTHGGECLAGLVQARAIGYIRDHETAILDSTAHALKFAGFQNLYFEDRFPPEFCITPQPTLQNAPVLVSPKDIEQLPETGNPLTGKALDNYIDRVAGDIAARLALKSR